IFNAGKAHYREHRPELLLANERGVVGDVADDRWTDEEALPVDGLAASDDLAVSPCVLKERLYLLELRIVLNRAHLRVFLETITDDGRLCEPTQLITNRVVDRIVDVEPFDGNAGLTGQHRGRGKDLRRHFLGVSILENDGRVVPAEFQR